MKNLLITVGLLIAFAAGTYAQAPDSVRMSFEKKYPGVKATWRNENGNYSAFYNDTKNQQRMVRYDRNGRMVLNRTHINRTDVPAGINTYYKSTYPNATTYDVWMEEDDRGNKTYYSIYENKRLYFDNKGTYQRSGTLMFGDPGYVETSQDRNDNINMENKETPKY